MAHWDASLPSAVEFPLSGSALPFDVDVTTELADVFGYEIRSLLI